MQDSNSTPAWAGIHSLISDDEKVSVKKVGFLPIIPQPLTVIETVYNCIKNFKYIASKLKQKTLPVAPDEVVYHYDIKIYLDRPEMVEGKCEEVTMEGI